MCCNICHKYDECEENSKIKDKCCLQCADYEYCQDSKDFNGAEDDFDDDDKKFRDYC